MNRARMANWLIPILVGMVLFYLPFPLLAKEAAPDSVLSLTDQEEIYTYSSFIEGYVNQNWKRENPANNLYRVTLLTITKRERMEQLQGQYNYCWVMLQLGREIDECVACFWQPDKLSNSLAPFEFKGIFVVTRKLAI